jgi:DNA-binding response OmpR family regulator
VSQKTVLYSALHPVIGLLVRHILQPHYALIACNSFAEFQNQLHQDVFVVLFDLSDQGCDLACIRQARQISRLPIIVIDTQAELSDEAYVRALGVNGYLTSPFSREQLLSLIRHFEP